LPNFKELEKRDAEHAKNIEKLNAEWAEKLAVADTEHAEKTTKLVEMHKRELEAEKKLRSPKRITFDWKFSKVAKRFVFICVVAILSIAGNIKQYTVFIEHEKTIKELETYSTIVRFIIARNDNIVSDIHRIWKEYQTPDSTELKRFIEDKILEYESGRQLLKKR